MPLVSPHAQVFALVAIALTFADIDWIPVRGHHRHNGQIKWLHQCRLCLVLSLCLLAVISALDISH